MYDASNMVDINQLEGDADDWERLVDVKRIVSEEELDTERSVAEHMKKKYPDIDYSEEQILEMSKRNCPFLKPGIVEWLDKNIKPQKNGEPGWSMGNEQYRILQSYKLTLWFQRRNDAKKFIRTWSSFGKATSYFNYFDDPITNLVLDLKTGKYHDRH